MNAIHDKHIRQGSTKSNGAFAASKLIVRSTIKGNINMSIPCATCPSNASTLEAKDQTLPNLSCMFPKYQ